MKRAVVITVSRLVGVTFVGEDLAVTDDREPRVPSPCSVPWSRMAPDEGGRRCDTCDVVVLDSRLHTREAFLERVDRGEKVCARLRNDGAGRVLFADTRRRLAVFARGAALSAALVGCGDDATPPSATEPRAVAPAPERIGRVMPTPLTAPPTAPPTTATAPTSIALPPEPPSSAAAPVHHAHHRDGLTPIGGADLGQGTVVADPRPRPR